MRQLSWGSTALALFSLPCLSLHAQQTPIDYLDKELAQVQQEHQETKAQTLANFFAELDQARNSAQAAIELYQKAGGAMPAATEVKAAHSMESQRERAEREQQDAAKLVNLAIVAQLQCGLLRYGGVYVTTPDQAGLHDSWVAWLKAVPQTYTQLRDEGPKEVRDQIRDLKAKPIKDSAITRYLNFRGWGDKEQGTWSVRDIPKLYRAEILEPTRVTPTAETLVAWDVYIALKQTDQPDPEKWAQNDLPPLAFDRACDAYKISGSMEKLQDIVKIIKANPNLPKADDLIGRARELVADYRTRHPSPGQIAAAAAAAAPAADPNVSVHTEGDMTIITTKSTNAAPVSPGP